MPKGFFAAIVVCLALPWCTPASGQISIVNGEGATIQDLIREGALVTIVLKESRARDRNVRITGVHERSMTILTEDGEATAYPTSMIAEVRVQDGRVRSQSLALTRGGALDTEDKQVIERAGKRAYEIFTKTRSNQSLRMQAAAIIAASGNRDAQIYLRSLANGNDTPTAIDAATHLFVIGDEFDSQILTDGMLSGNRQTRAAAAKLVGLIQDTSFTIDLRRLLQEPNLDVYPAAARAIARVGDRASIPGLLKSMTALTTEKGEAAVSALSTLGGEDVRAAMLDMLSTSKGIEWFRVVRVLHAIGDEQGQKIMREECLRLPAFRDSSAMLLARENDWDATLYLRESLDRTEDPNLENLQRRARVAAILFEGGYMQAKVVLQGLLRLQPDQIYSKGRTGDREYKLATIGTVQKTVLEIIGELGNRNLLPLTTAALESANPEVALAACEAALSIANEKFRVKLAESRR